MSLSAHERHQLEEIERTLHDEDPGLEQLAERLTGRSVRVRAWLRAAIGFRGRHGSRSPRRGRRTRKPRATVGIVLPVLAAALVPATTVAILLAVLVASPVSLGAAFGLGGLCVAVSTALTTSWARRRRSRTG